MCRHCPPGTGWCSRSCPASPAGGHGTDRGKPRADAIAAVHAVTRDPRLLGIQAGVAMADPQGIGGPTVELLRAAGADMEIAEKPRC